MVTKKTPPKGVVSTPVPKDTTKPGAKVAMRIAAKKASEAARKK